jgi:hypothetical protein
VSLPIEEASAKIRSGPPQGAAEEYAPECWAGVLPLQLTAGLPQRDPRLRGAAPTPVLRARLSGPQPHLKARSGERRRRRRCAPPGAPLT